PTMSRRSSKPIIFDLSNLDSIKDDQVLIGLINKSLATINKTFEQYRFDEIALCFNGGKDCVVLLHLIHHVLVQRHIKNIKNNNNNNNNIDNNNRVNKDVDDIPQLRTLYFKANDCFEQVTKFTEECAASWPQFIRVSPILDWDYCNVWKFLKTFNVPYCTLYDEGYTSIGNKGDTVPNPALKDESTGQFSPAHLLRDGTLERSGRQNRPKLVQTN
ncbi:hypothetical protein SAMD00019534_079080, partial [Acytostelium subglobosum LB1]|uniref:hypothetical protein n=1 Tax=Acytostelium subglobosum LB1 TaxID=1410327 RepID=UPI000644AA42